MEGKKRLKRRMKKHKWFRLCDVIVFSRASSDSVTREIIRIITATRSAERARAKSKARLAQRRREPLWCSCIDIKKNLTKEFSVKHSPGQEVDLQISQSKFIANTETWTPSNYMSKGNDEKSEWTALSETAGLPASTYTQILTTNWKQLQNRWVQWSHTG